MEGDESSLGEVPVLLQTSIDDGALHPPVEELLNAPRVERKPWNFILIEGSGARAAFRSMASLADWKEGAAPKIATRSYLTVRRRSATTRQGSEPHWNPCYGVNIA